MIRYAPVQIHEGDDGELILGVHSGPVNDPALAGIDLNELHGKEIRKVFIAWANRVLEQPEYPATDDWSYPGCDELRDEVIKRLEAGESRADVIAFLRGYV